MASCQYLVVMSKTFGDKSFHLKSGFRLCRIFVVYEEDTVTCSAPFTQHSTGCYLAGTGTKQWQAAEDDCNSYGINSHLVSPDTEEVIPITR